MGRSRKWLCAPPEDEAEGLGRDPVDGSGRVESCSNIWLPGLVERIAAELPGNGVACTLRLVDRASAAQFRDRNVVTLSEPSPRPAFAARWSPPGSCRDLDLERRRDLLRLTAAAGDVANLGVAVEAAGILLGASVIGFAAKAGELEACKWLSEPGRMPPYVNCRSAALENAAGGGHRAVCEWCLEPAFRRTVWDAEAVLAAARRGHLELMDWLLVMKPYGCKAPKQCEILEAAAARCGLAAFQQLCGRRMGLRFWDPEQKEGLLLFASAMHPTPEWRAKCDLLLAHGCTLDCPELAYEWACDLPGEEALERFRFFEEQGFAPAEFGNLGRAVKAGNVAATRYLLSRGVRTGYEASQRSAAFHGKLDGLKVLHSEGCELDVRRLADAACEGGHISVMEWLVETFGAEAVGLQRRHSRLLSHAAGAGSVELMRWLLARGVAWDGAEWSAAAMSGCEAVLDLLLEEDRGVPTDGQCYAEAARNGDLSMLRALRSMGVPFGPSNGQAFASAVWCSDGEQGAPLEALQWLLEAGCPLDQGRAMVNAMEAVDACAVPNPDTGEVSEYALAEARRVREWLEGQRRPRRPRRLLDA